MTKPEVAAMFDLVQGRSSTAVVHCICEDPSRVGRFFVLLVFAPACKEWVVWDFRCSPPMLLNGHFGEEVNMRKEFIDRLARWEAAHRRIESVIADAENKVQGIGKAR